MVGKFKVPLDSYCFGEMEVERGPSRSVCVCVFVCVCVCES